MANKKTNKSSKKSNKNLNFYQKLSKRSKIIGLVIFALVATAIIGGSFAATNNKNTNQEQFEEVILSVSDEKPLVITREPNGKIVHQSRGKSIEITASGVAYCTPDGDGNVKVVNVTQEDIDKVKAESTKVSTNNKVETSVTPEVEVGGGKKLQISDTNNSGDLKTIDSDKSVNKEIVNNAEKLLDQVCLKEGRDVQSKDLPTFVPEKSRPIQNSKKRSFLGLNDKVYAGGEPAALPALDTPTEDSQFKLINNARQSNGLALLGRSECITKAARIWSYNMALVNTLYHSQLQPMVERECGSGWWSKIGENVGKIGAGPNQSEAVFDAYMKSPGHRANILDPVYQRVGVGAYTYKHPSNPSSLSWTTHMFAACIGTCANK